MRVGDFACEDGTTLVNKTQGFFLVESFDEGSGPFVRIATLGVGGARFTGKFVGTRIEMLFARTASYGWTGSFVGGSSGGGGGGGGGTEMTGETGQKGAEGGNGHLGECSWRRIEHCL